jgi:hypothetical protein
MSAWIYVIFLAWYRLGIAKWRLQLKIPQLNSLQEDVICQFQKIFSSIPEVVLYFGQLADQDCFASILRNAGLLFVLPQAWLMAFLWLERDALSMLKLVIDAGLAAIVHGFWHYCATYSLA